MATLHLPLIGEDFHQIKAGTKPKEYRLFNDYWIQRLVGRSYNRVVLTWGYPKADDTERRISCPWQGYTIETIQHEHFGPDPVTVFSIDVRNVSPV